MPGCKLKSFKYLLLFLVLVCVFLAYICQTRTLRIKSENEIPRKYLVSSKHCKIPAYDVEYPEIMNLIKMENYRPCQEDSPLTEVSYIPSMRKYVLRMTRTPDVPCFFSENDLSPKHALTVDTYLNSDSEFVYVVCRNLFGLETYMNFHTLIPYYASIEEKVKEWESLARKPLSVLVFGIDTMSRLNFFRTMPSTSKVVLDDDNEWFPMEGYNKVGLNTFPNVMAALKGWSEEDIYRICDPENKYLDVHCPLIWKNFQKSGYVTAYAEDFNAYSTFKFLKKGFKNHPTDYDFIPIFKKASSLSFLRSCIGFKRGPEMVYEYAIEFAKRFKDTPYFGFFWTNDFSHHYISEPSSMDSKVSEYLKELITGDTLENTIVFLMSDHGVRFGTPREVPIIGRHEDFLPLMYIRLPMWFKNERKDIVDALKANRNILSSPFDIFMTFKNILDMSNPKYPIPNSTGCPRCQSLFQNITQQRSCATIGIPSQFCACEDFAEPCNQKISYEIGATIVKYLNSKILEHNNKSNVSCRFFDIQKFPSVSRQSNGQFRANLFLLPGGIIEGYVDKIMLPENKYKLVVTNVQRIDEIGKDASLICPVERDILEFCFCL